MQPPTRFRLYFEETLRGALADGSKPSTQFTKINLETANEAWAPGVLVASLRRYHTGHPKCEFLASLCKE